MAYVVTGQSLYNDIMYTLLESADAGAAEPTSGLYTRAEVMARLNYRMTEFNQQTGMRIQDGYIGGSGFTFTTVSTPNTTRDVDIPTDCIDIIQVAVESATGNAIYTVIPQGSMMEADFLIPDETTAVTTMPTIWVQDIESAQKIAVIPPPSTARQVRYLYVVRPTALASPPDTTVTEIVDDWTPFVKFGALADLFGKSGETYDPERQALCEQLYQLGVDVANSMIRGLTQ